MRRGNERWGRADMCCGGSGPACGRITAPGMGCGEGCGEGCSGGDDVKGCSEACAERMQRGDAVWGCSEGSL